MVVKKAAFFLHTENISNFSNCLTVIIHIYCVEACKPLVSMPFLYA